MIRVGLARTQPSYAGLAPPFGPGETYPELAALLGEAEGGANPVYGAVRQALRALGLDAERYGSAEWNPLGALVARGGRVVLKPNFIRHWNPSPNGSVESLVTHGSVLRAVAVALAVPASVALIIANYDDMAQRGKAFALYGFGIMVAGLLAPLLMGFVADKLDIPEAGLTAADVARHFAEHGLGADKADNLARILRSCERAQYGAARLSASEVEALVQGAALCMDELDSALKKEHRR